MIEIKEGQQCQDAGCDHLATVVVLDRQDGYSLKAVCERHAERIVNHDSPEYVQDCPNCGCRTGIN